MAKKTTNISGKKKTTRVRKQEEEVNLNVIEDIGRKELISFIVGLVLVVLAVFMLISFCSYLYTGIEDFDKLENTTPEVWLNEQGLIKNTCGVLGGKIAFFFLHSTFGLASFIIIPYMVIAGFRMMRIYRVSLLRRFILGTLMMVWTSVAFASVDYFIDNLDDTFINLGGNHGKLVVKWLVQLVGTPGLFGLLVLTALLFFIYVSTKTIMYIRAVLRMNFIRKIRLGRNKADEQQEEEAHEGSEDEEAADNQEEEGNDNGEEKEHRVPEQQEGPLEVEFTVDSATSDVGDVFTANLQEQNLINDNVNDNDNPSTTFRTTSENDGSDDDQKEPDFDVTAKETEQGDGDIERGDLSTPYDPKLDLASYKYPPISLVMNGTDSSPAIDMAEQTANKERITHVLRNFGVEISSIKATIGPTITLYEIVPQEGTRISKIRNLEDDIALSLAAEGIRIIAPIPGKGTIGIEVPNKKKCIVSMESILSSKAYQENTMELPCAVGKTITNEVFMFDLAKAPHLLVAGATGQGKSVGLNAIVASLLYMKHPSELKIVMVDPKKVEFSIYSPIENHFLARLEEEEECIITDVQKVVKTLTSLCQLMDSRYDLLKKAGCRNIKEYNAKFKARQLNPEHGHEFMQYIVVIVDEFGDLIMTAGKEVETPICRIAQLARAVGIHMIIATQRPQASIISGAIKTNFPARMAFKVSSMIDSRVVLDRPGAQQLIGKGDMLFLSGSEPVRVQCAFLDTPEVMNVCNYIAKQQGYLHPYYLPEVVGEEGDGGGIGSVDVKRLDPLFAEVASFVVNSQQGSTSMIQRNYSIGYNRAGKIMDQLEKMGVVGPQVGAKPREVLIKDPLTLQSILNSIG